MNENNGSYRLYGEETSSTFNQFLSKVFMWMFYGLILTTGAAFFVASSDSFIIALYTNNLLFYGLIIGEFALVIFLSARVLKMSYGMAIGAFSLYSILNGLTLSSVLLVYTAESVFTVFLAAALIFGVMATYGYVTKTDLSAFRTFMMIGIFGLIGVSILNIFIASSGLSLVIGYIGVGLFAGITAYDIQSLKKIYSYSLKSNIPMKNMAISGALRLYLDFVNLFLYLLRILGKRR
jgi:FtsH-binding integral membrane protein